VVVHSDIWGWCQLIGCCILSSWICVGCWRGRSECAGRLVGKELMEWEFMYLRVRIDGSCRIAQVCGREEMSRCNCLSIEGR